ncbi:MULTISPECIES: (deoxy)nucleoside triphosphate pyrophosphohydrolase [Sphingobacterium]|uniref:8-oxo-dGTP diphosphatase n=1 Tax=Sphingobacterium tenebrionis TaxID=3111775 RepID=A0ABU8I8V3_9SPHI|nr:MULTISPECIES: (deoxy)nucleoside triphosphate pyrophosphohydrolase [unclassified Sphingobacterium]QBR12901.1 (deoxy)nucleoside triphosphate pyrophosphohydrolase [Sphingobacterium sp. CZ-2]
MIHVACALIEKDQQILICQRSASMKLPLKWEFPGGKQEEGESLEECLLREVKEEINLDISIEQALTKVEYHYPDFSLTLYPYVCKLKAGELKVLEHEQVIWVDQTELFRYDWANADLPVIEEYIRTRR